MKNKRQGPLRSLKIPTVKFLKASYYSRFPREILPPAFFYKIREKKDKKQTNKQTHAREMIDNTR